MLEEKQKIFIKNNSEMLSSIFSDKLSELLLLTLDENKTDLIPVINILRSWLREIDMIKNGKEIKPQSFI